jgi:nucleoside-diphosphate-sugar epimerase
MIRTVLVLGGGGFIGNHLVEHLKKKGYYVRAVDLKHPPFQEASRADEFVIGDLRDEKVVSRVMLGPKQRSLTDVINSFDEVYQLAADMGGAGFVFTGENDADILSNSVRINLNVARFATLFGVKKVLYTSSACVYPDYNQKDPENPICEEASAYPANPDSEYGWEKLFSERLYFAYKRNKGLDVRIVRLHNIFGPLGTYEGGREKAPAAICRKIAALPPEGGVIEVWGNGAQTRSFLYVDECVEGLLRIMASDFAGPVNLGSEEMVTINELVDRVAEIADKAVEKRHVPGPIGVPGRNSDNRLLRSELGWEPCQPLTTGLRDTYAWIEGRIQASTS